MTTGELLAGAAPERRERGRVRRFLSLVMIEHSVFALPFAYIAALTAMWQQTRSVHWVQLLLITVAMVSARTVAMSANRILDRGFDALNPRTARRELVTGEVSLATAWTGTAVALAVFLATAAALSWLCLALAPIAVGLLVLYSYGKRFTDFPQVLLALAQFVAPVGAWIAVVGHGSWAATALGHRRRHVDRRVRPDLRLPGLRDRRRDRRPVGARPLRHPRRPARVGARARAHGRRVRLVRRRGRARLVVVDGRRAHRRGAGVRARHRPAERPLPREPGLLHRQRRHRHRAVRLRAGRPASCTGSAR